MNPCDKIHDGGEMRCQKMATCVFAFDRGELQVMFAGLEKYHGLLA